jgi:hypothetical protein
MNPFIFRARLISLVGGSLLFGTLVSADFEEVGTAARPWGMANAYTALATDHLALSYNPAGLSILENPEAGVGYNRLWAGLTDQSNVGSGHVMLAAPLRMISPTVPGGAGFGYSNTYLAGVYAEQTIALGYGMDTRSCRWCLT